MDCDDNVEVSLEIFMASVRATGHIQSHCTALKIHHYFIIWYAVNIFTSNGTVREGIASCINGYRLASFEIDGWSRGISVMYQLRMRQRMSPPMIEATAPSATRRIDANIGRLLCTTSCVNTCNCVYAACKTRSHPIVYVLGIEL